MQRVLNFIDGHFREPLAGEWFSNINPATAEVFSEIPDSSAKDIDWAVDSARRAFLSWSDIPVAKRSEFLYRIADLIERRRQQFAELESKDQGKPVVLADAMDIQRAIHNFRFFAGSVLHHENESTEMDASAFNYVTRRPVGVAGLISPWNLPLYLLTWKIAPALAAGNTVVCKPSEFTSMTAALLCEVFQEAGLPAGVCNMVFGTGPKVGDPLVRHPHVPLISFTGGTDTGRKIFQASADHFKKLSLELGGKNPTILFADCDHLQALPMVLRSSFLNQGEICLCGSRIYVEESYFEKFLTDFVNETQKLKVGDPTQADTFMGPLVSEAHYRKVLSYIKLAESEGGQILCGGGRPALAAPFDKGYFLRPTVIAGLPETSRCIQEEIFGPVVTVSTFKTKEDAAFKANSVKYGLSASVWTSDLTKAHWLARELNVGTVWINTWLMRDLRMPFGGTKASGIGREGGKHSLDFFTEAKTVNVRYSW